MILRILLLWCIAITATCLLTTLGLLTFFLPIPHIRYKIITFWSVIFIFLSKRLCGIDYKVTGEENITRQKVAIVACKHQSSWETFFMQVLLPEQTWVVKKELLWIPIFGWSLALLSPIAINRSNRKKAAMKVASAGCDRLKKGKWVIIFPEGTRVKPGEQKRYGRSAARLAIESGVPIIPIAHNAGVFWKNKILKKQKGTIEVVVGQPIDPTNKDPKELTAQIEKWIEDTVATLAKN